MQVVAQIRTLVTNKLHTPLLGNTIAVIITRGVTTITRTAALLIVASIASPEKFGIIIFSITCAEIAKVIADLGIDTLTIRNYARSTNTNEHRVLSQTVATTKVVSCIIAYVVLLLYALLGKYRDSLNIFALSSLFVFTGSWVNLSINFFQAKLTIPKIIKPVIFINITSIITIIIQTSIAPNTIYTIALLVFFEIVLALILWIRLSKHVGFIYPKILEPIAILSLLHQSFPIAITIIIVTAYTRLDVLILSTFASSTVTGFYGIAFRFTEPIQLAAAALATSVYSYLSTVLSDNEIDVRSFIFKYGLLVITYSIFSVSLLQFVLPPAIRYALPEYVPAIEILRILAIALVFRTLNGCLTAIVQAYGQFNRITVLALWNLFTISCLLLFLVPRLGGAGAALALFIGEGINTIIQLALVKRIIIRKVKLPQTGVLQ